MFVPTMTADRTLEDLAAKFRRFAAHEAPKAPLYVRLAAAIAEDREMLVLASHARAGQPVPNLLFAAVQDRLLDDPDQPLAAHYPEIGGGRPNTDPWPSFRAPCLGHADTIIPILETRIVQTNEVGRCALLLPALALAWRHGGELAHSVSREWKGYWQRAQ